VLPARSHRADLEQSSGFGDFCQSTHFSYVLLDGVLLNLTLVLLLQFFRRNLNLVHAGPNNIYTLNEAHTELYWSLQNGSGADMIVV
jgi:hypothetical protein